MPKPAAPGVVDDEPVVVLDPEVTVKPSDPALEVDLETTPTPEPTADEKLSAKIRADFEKLYGGKLEQVENRLRGAQRINTQLQQKVSTLEQRLTPPAPVTPQSAKDAELQALVDKGEWQVAVARVASEQAEKLYQDRTALAQRQAALQVQEQTLETSKSLVIQKYPDLDPETGDAYSDISRVYVAILNQDPALLSNPYGPEIAMYRMEQALQQQTTGVQSAETIRQQRVGQTQLAPPRTTPGNGKVVLTHEQKEFIDYHGIDPKTYARIQQSLAQSGGVEV